MNRVWRIAWLLPLVAALASCQAGYIFRQATGQWSVVWGSEPISSALEDPRISDEKKQKILLIDEIAAFGEREIGLVRNENYTTYYETNGKPVSYNIFVCPKTSLIPMVWRFPIVGEIPYLGFFDIEAAKEQQKALQEQGYDVYLSTVWGYSTLGWFRDPIFSAMLNDDEVSLARLILHEMTHATIYRAGEAEFNETLADFIGDHGAELFLAKKYGVEGPAVQELWVRINEEAQFDDWLKSFTNELNHLFEGPGSEDEKLAQREQVYSRSLDRLKSLAASGNRAAKGMENAPWNNALVLGLTTYRTSPEYFDELYRKSYMNLRLFLQTILSSSSEEYPHSKPD